MPAQEAPRCEPAQRRQRRQTPARLEPVLAAERVAVEEDAVVQVPQPAVACPFACRSPLLLRSLFQPCRRQCVASLRRRMCWSRPPLAGGRPSCGCVPGTTTGGTFGSVVDAVWLPVASAVAPRLQDPHRQHPPLRRSPLNLLHPQRRSPPPRCSHESSAQSPRKPPTSAGRHCRGLPWVSCRVAQLRQRGNADAHPQRPQSRVTSPRPAPASGRSMDSDPAPQVSPRWKTLYRRWSQRCRRWQRWRLVEQVDCLGLVGRILASYRTRRRQTRWWRRWQLRPPCVTARDGRARWCWPRSGCAHKSFGRRP